MSISAKVREQLLSSFRAELAEHVQTMTDGLLALEQGKVSGGQRQTMLADIFRAAHSLKGASRAMGVTAIEQLAHALESALDGVRHERVEPTEKLFSACYRALDAIEAVQASYESGEITPPAQALQAVADLEPFRVAVPRPAAEEPGGAEPENPTRLDANPVAGFDSDSANLMWMGELAESASIAGSQGVARTVEGDETIRVNVTKLDRLMAQMSELLVTKIRAEQRLLEIREFQSFVTQWQKEWTAVRSAYNQLVREGAEKSGRGAYGREVLRLLDYLGMSQGRLRDMNGMVSDLARDYANDTLHMSLVIDDLEEEVKRVRMLPLNTITRPFRRMVRDLAHAAGKEAVLEIEGGETELDKRVLEQIKDPLIHLLRNAVDHGIEPPRERERLGKDPVGRIVLTAEQLGKDVVIGVTDDGAGLDLDRIRQVADRQIRGGGPLLRESELVEAIFKAGVSTKPIITDISGRGVGLDVVRRNVEILHGRIEVDWQAGGGTTFLLILPQTLTSSRGLLVEASGQRFVIPLGAIERIRIVEPSEIEPLEGLDTIRHNGQPLALVRLSDVLGLDKAAKIDQRANVVVLTAAERRMAFVVDELGEEQEVVIKGLGSQLSRVGGIAGATVLGSGEIVLILNVGDLIKLAMRGERKPIAGELVERQVVKERVEGRILIVDDSITTRTLEKNILEAAGYTVELATDGQEAWNLIMIGEVPSLVVSDVAMPRMNGFELTRKIKEESRTADVPVVLVTSLDSEEDKARGIEAGADAYITKGRFDQGNLLETIGQLI